MSSRDQASRSSFSTPTLSYASLALFLTTQIDRLYHSQVSKLSKIRKSSWMIPTPRTYVRECDMLSAKSFAMLTCILRTGSVLSHIGVNGGAVGQPHISNPYSGHAPVQVSYVSLHSSAELIFLRISSGSSTTFSATRSGSTTIATYILISDDEPLRSASVMLERQSKGHSHLHWQCWNKIFFFLSLSIIQA